MKFIMYGTQLCPDCVEAKKLMAENKIALANCEITDSVANLKAFLAIRDAHENTGIFDAVRAAGGVGVPCFVFEDGTITLDTISAIEKAKQ